MQNVIVKNPGSVFDLLTKEDIEKARTYFSEHPEMIKYSRKEADAGYSFINTELGIFAISRARLGVGASGKVKLGKNLTSGDLVAVKIQLFKFADLADLKYEQLTQEAEALIKLRQLYTIVHRWLRSTVPSSAVHSVLEAESSNKNPENTAGLINNNNKYSFKFYLFTVFFRSITLYSYFKDHLFNLQEAVEILIKVLEKLQALHQLGIIHGDLSFNNILLSSSNTEKFVINLVDFGLSGFVACDAIKFNIHKYKFTKDRYLPPESDPAKVLEVILPNLSARNIGIVLEAKQNLLGLISSWAQAGYGFNTYSSDLYTLGWNLYNFSDLSLYSEFMEIYTKHIYLFDPWDRIDISQILIECKKLLIEISFTKKICNLGFFNKQTKLSSGKNQVTSRSLSNDSSETYASYLSNASSLDHANSSTNSLDARSNLLYKALPVRQPYISFSAQMLPKVPMYQLKKYAASAAATSKDPEKTIEVKPGKLLLIGN